jgi:hypothetical protein
MTDTQCGRNRHSCTTPRVTCSLVTLKGQTLVAEVADRRLPEAAHFAAAVAADGLQASETLARRKSERHEPRGLLQPVRRQSLAVEPQFGQVALQVLRSIRALPPAGSRHRTQDKPRTPRRRVCSSAGLRPDILGNDRPGSTYCIFIQVIESAVKAIRRPRLSACGVWWIALN